MKTPIKNCKGINKSRGFQGCGKPSLNRKFGLCASCLWEWMCNDERGKIWREKQFIPRVAKKQKQLDRQEIKKKKIELMTPDKYRKTYLQPIINKIARLIDYGQPCIATGNFGKSNGGHFYSVGAHRTLALNLHNIHIQSFESNTFRGGDDKKYRNGLYELYGSFYLEFVEGLRRHRPINLSKVEMIKIKTKAQSICNSLERNNYMRNFEERIIARNYVNRQLEIYDEDFSIYDIEKLELKRA